MNEITTNNCPTFEYTEPRYFVAFQIDSDDGKSPRWFRNPMMSLNAMKDTIADVLAKKNVITVIINLEESLDKEATSPDEYGEGLGYTRRSQLYGCWSQECHEMEMEAESFEDYCISGDRGFWSYYGFNGPLLIGDVHLI